MYRTPFLYHPILSTWNIPSELLNDDYIFTKKIKLASKTEDGCSYTVTGVQSPKDNAIDAEASAKLKVKGTTITGKLQTGAKDPIIEAKYEAKDSEGRNYTLGGDFGRNLAKSHVEFVGGPLGVKVSGDLIASEITASAALAISSSEYSGFAVVGAETQYSVADKEISKLNYALSFLDGRESECTLHVLDQAKSGMISYSHHVRPGFSVGAQMLYVRETAATSLSVGTAYRLDGATTIKGKLDSAGTMSLSYIQNVRPNTTLIMSSKFNTATFDSAKLGISLAIE